jgi:hypothetical protein
LIGSQIVCELDNAKPVLYVLPIKKYPGKLRLELPAVPLATLELFHINYVASFLAHKTVDQIPEMAGGCGL